MSVCLIAQAKDHLSKLIDEALAGEEVTIARHGKPAAELRPARAIGAGRPAPELIDRIAARAKHLASAKNAGAALATFDARLAEAARAQGVEVALG